jgi:pSer/pThr/pTyr-binding forkhead associated (FHA) protein
VICTTCGADNASHLTFCQECGQRLAPRVAPPTPPVGLQQPADLPQTSPLAATALAPQGTPSTAPSPTRQRPAAPEVRFVPRAEAQGGAPGPLASAPSVAAAPVGVPTSTVGIVMCPLCGSVNHQGIRFCVTCGHLLATTPAPVETKPGVVNNLMQTMPEPPKFESPPVAAAANAPAIAPARVVEVGVQPRVAAQRVCPRCRGTSDLTGPFCRFCGAQLGDAPSPVLQPSPNPIAPTPAPVGVAAAPVAAPGPVVARSPPAVPPAPRPAPAAAPAVPVPVAPTAQPGATRVRARLVLVGRDGAEGPSYPLGESTDIGRVEGNIVISEDRYMSPRHARIAARHGGFTLRDLESTNGIFVRIPFPRSVSDGAHAGGGRGERDREQGHPADAAGHGSGRAMEAENAANAAANMGSGEQLLLDQDLFLVGQQVLRFEVVKSADEGFGVASENGTLLFGTPAAPRYARLAQRTVEGVVRDVFHVRKAETVIGREQGDIVFTDDPFLSRRHCMLRVNVGAAGGSPRTFALSDLGSSNGTFLQVRDEVRLRHGDHFRIGQQLFRFDT